MKKFVVLKKKDDISPIHDVEMLGLLLYDILDFFDKPNKEILFGEIDTFVRLLGYQNTMSVVHNTLLYNNFLTEIEKGSRYALTKTNRNAIQTFFQKHKIEFEGNRLTNIEYALILGSSGIQGSRVEALLAQVMGSLAFLMDTLSQIPHLENSVKEEIAEHVMKSLILRERIGWNVNRLHQIQESIPKPYNYLEEVAKTCMVIDSGEQQNLLLDKVLRDEEILKKLHIVRTLLTYIVTAFSIWEEKIE